MQPSPLLVLGLLALLAAPSLPPVEAGERAAELAAIETTLDHYLEGGKSGHVDHLRQAFHPRARLQFVSHGTYREWSLEEYLRGRTPGKRSDSIGRVLSIHFTGNAASAKLELASGAFTFTDYISLLKIDGRWWIVNKIFYKHEE
jgi:hypothetical protein